MFPVQHQTISLCLILQIHTGKAIIETVKYNLTNLLEKRIVAMFGSIQFTVSINYPVLHTNVHVVIVNSNNTEQNI